MTAMTLSERLLDTNTNLLKKAAMVAAGVMALAISAKVQILQVPVPVTLQVLVVMSIGMAYGSRMAFATVAAYLMTGLAGAPVFAGALAGPLYLMGATGGYLIGFLMAATLVGYLAEKGWDRNFATMAAAMALGLFAIYALGVAWLCYGSNLLLSGGEFGGYGLEHWYDYGVKTFIWVDALKLAVAIIAFPTIWKAIGEKR